MDCRGWPITTTPVRFPSPDLKSGFKDVTACHSQLGFVKERRAALVVRASSKVNVNVTWSDKERNEKQVEY